MEDKVRSTALAERSGAWGWRRYVMVRVGAERRDHLQENQAITVPADGDDRWLRVATVQYRFHPLLRAYLSHSIEGNYYLLPILPIPLSR